jgi:hypothetical protein
MWSGLLIQAGQSALVVPLPNRQAEFPKYIRVIFIAAEVIWQTSLTEFREMSSIYLWLVCSSKRMTFCRFTRTL